MSSPIELIAILSPQAGKTDRVSVTTACIPVLPQSLIKYDAGGRTPTGRRWIYHQKRAGYTEVPDPPRGQQEDRSWWSDRVGNVCNLIPARRMLFVLVFCSPRWNYSVCVDMLVWRLLRSIVHRRRLKISVRYWPMRVWCKVRHRSNSLTLLEGFQGCDVLILVRVGGMASFWIHIW